MDLVLHHLRIFKSNTYFSPQLTASLNPYPYHITYCQDNNGCVIPTVDLPPQVNVIVNPTPEASIFAFVPNDICEVKVKT